MLRGADPKDAASPVAAEQWFAEYDLDGSGRLSSAELAAGLRRSGVEISDAQTLAFMEAAGISASPEGDLAVRIEAFQNLLQCMARAEFYGQRAFSANTPTAGVPAPQPPKGEDLEIIQVSFGLGWVGVPILQDEFLEKVL